MEIVPLRIHDKHMYTFITLSSMDPKSISLVVSVSNFIVL